MKIEDVTLEINSLYTDLDYAQESKNSELDKIGFKNFHTPFRCLALPSFIQAREASGLENGSVGETEERGSNSLTASFLSKLKEEIAELDLNPKNNDLYQFSQSEDLKNLNDTEYPELRKARNLFSDSVREWMSKLTGVELRSDYVALTVSSYDYTDYLLCHDDELEERRIAFVLYLTPNWTSKDGGRLDLFSSDEHGQPKFIVESIVPQLNLLSMFEVSEKSFHQVCEVTKDSGTPRLSINGWYHGAPVPRGLPFVEAKEEFLKPTSVSYETVITWINPEYLNEDVQKEIRQKFENDSEIELQNFLQEEKYQLVSKEILECNQFRDEIVPNKRWYSRISELEEAETSGLSVCRELFRSEAMFLLLSQLTGLNLHPLLDLEQEKEEAGTQDTSKKECSDAAGVLDAPILVVSQAPKSPESAKKRRRSASPNPEMVPESKKPKVDQEGVLSPVFESNSTKEDLKSGCLLEYRKFQNGNYTLMHDCEWRDNCGQVADSSDQNNFLLDAQLFFTEDEWATQNGGYTCYVAKGEEEELLTVAPKGNSLALVYRDPETLKFVKYVNSKVTKTQNFKFNGFCDLNGTYCAFC